SQARSFGWAGPRTRRRDDLQQEHTRIPRTERARVPPGECPESVPSRVTHPFLPAQFFTAARTCRADRPTGGWAVRCRSGRRSLRVTAGGHPSTRHSDLAYLPQLVAPVGLVLPWVARSARSGSRSYRGACLSCSRRLTRIDRPSAGCCEGLT